MIKKLSLTLALTLALTACDRWPAFLRKVENEGERYYFETEVDQEDVEAAYKAAKANCCGEDTFKDDVKALNFYCMAAKNGHKASMFEVAKLYGGYDTKKSTIIPRDNALAFTFFSVAEQKGFENAESYRKEILNEISDKDFARATKLISQFPNIPCEITR
jgi:TPR repeat protein